MRCGSCGWDSPQGIIFCTNCGKRLSERESPGQLTASAVGAAAAAPTALAQAGASQASLKSAPLVPGGTQVFVENRASAGVVNCPGCGAPGEPGMRFCRECGSSLAQATPRVDVAAPAAPACARCGNEREPNASFCRHCGASFRESGPLNGYTPQDTQATAPSRSPVPRLVTLLKDGSEGRSIPLTEKDADVGGSEGDITFPDDPYISSRHARIVCRGGTYSLRDLDSINGVYVRLREAVELRDRDMLLVGQQVLRFEVLGDGELPLGPAFQHGVMVFGTPEVARFGRLVQYTTEGVPRDVHYLFRDETVIGRENGDIVFTDDPFLSRRHAAIRVDHAGRRFVLSDLGSSNGTALRIRGEHVLKDADQFRIGRHLFRFEAGQLAGSRVAR